MILAAAVAPVVTRAPVPQGSIDGADLVFIAVVMFATGLLLGWCLWRDSSPPPGGGWNPPPPPEDPGPPDPGPGPDPMYVPKDWIKQEEAYVRWLKEQFDEVFDLQGLPRPPS